MVHLQLAAALVQAPEEDPHLAVGLKQRVHCVGAAACNCSVAQELAYETEAYDFPRDPSCPVAAAAVEAAGQHSCQVSLVPAFVEVFCS